MAKAQAQNSKSGSGYGDLKRRVVFLVLALVVYRLGTHVPVPGINPDSLAELFQHNQSGI
ncbi:MAG: preprotein translocase subunit SecY, partial [Candidimonas sp.]